MRLLGIRFNKVIRKIFSVSVKVLFLLVRIIRMWFAKRVPILELLAELSARGVEVIVFTRQLSDKDKMLLSGVQVNVKEKLSLHASIIDKSVVWYGSVNYLGYNAEDNHTMRIMESSIAEEVMYE